MEKIETVVEGMLQKLCYSLQLRKRIFVEYGRCVWGNHGLEIQKVIEFPSTKRETIVIEWETWGILKNTDLWEELLTLSLLLHFD